MALGDPSLLTRCNAFAGLGERGLRRLEQLAERRSFRLGQPLCHDSQIPSEVLVVLTGTARLLVLDGGELRTAEKLGPGSVVGLASLLRALPCEEVAAAAAMEVLAIPDSLILSLLEEEPSFSAWAGGHLFSAELLALLAVLLERRAQAGATLLQSWRDLAPQARLVPPTAAALQPWPADQLLFAASHNLVDHPLGAQLDPAAGPPAVRGPLPPRLIALPAATLTALLTPAQLIPTSSEPDQAGALVVPEATGVPLASGLDLGQRDRPELRLLRGSGALEETLACFQMLAAQLKLPSAATPLKRSCGMCCAAARRRICSCAATSPPPWVCT
jgi:ATP-binding cassette, subfamily B, bacterial HlyB/CyaB